MLFVLVHVYCHVCRSSSCITTAFVTIIATIQYHQQRTIITIPRDEDNDDDNDDDDNDDNGDSDGHGDGDDDGDGDGHGSGGADGDSDGDADGDGDDNRDDDDGGDATLHGIFTASWKVEVDITTIPDHGG